MQLGHWQEGICNEASAVTRQRQASVHAWTRAPEADQSDS